jgi:Fuc2NAc and GlcNAc transferase
LAIVITFLAALSYLYLSEQLEDRIFLALAGGGILVAAIGYWDDHKDISPKTRILGHFAAAIWGTIWIGGIPQLDIGFATLDWNWLGYIVSVVGIVWLLNLYNFMDGIDGIAASEAIFAAGVGGALLANAGADGLSLAAVALAAACTGFLFWNWPKAKIFMGDVCSGFLGYTLAIFAIVSDQDTDISLWIWLLLLCVFVVDSTVTLLRRLMRGEKVYEAHRSHAYQHATTLVNSHLKVTLSVMGINLLFLLPLALITLDRPEVALATALVGVASLSFLAIYFNAGTDAEETITNQVSQ